MWLEGRAFPELENVKFCEKKSRDRGKHVTAGYSGHAKMRKVKESFK